MDYYIDCLKKEDYGKRVCSDTRNARLEIVFTPTADNPRYVTIFSGGRIEASCFEGTADFLLGELMNQPIVLFDLYFNKDFSFKEDDTTLFELYDVPDKLVARFDVGNRDYESEEERDETLNDPGRFFAYNWSDLTARDVYLFRLIDDCLNFHTEKQMPLTRLFINEMIKDQGLDIPTPHFHRAVFWQSTINEWKKRNSVFETYQEKTAEMSYSCSSLSDLVLILLYELSKDSVYLKKCGHCQKWFIPSTAKEQYCSRMTDGKTCKQIAKAILRKERGMTDLQKKYNSVRTSIANQKNKKHLTVDDERRIDKQVQDFSDQALELRKKVKQGMISPGEYSEWLDSQKLRRRKNNADD